jgi:hypothetical protein
MNKKYISFTLFVVILSISISSSAQMKRERANTTPELGETFWAPNLMGMSNVEQLDAGNLNVTIMHNFGIATTRPLQTFFGLDFGPNVRLGIDYGLTKNWSIGIGRSTFEKVIDLRSKIRLIRQQPNNNQISMSIKFDVGLTTVENRRPIEKDLNFLISLPIARKLNDAVSLQLAPMFSRFNTVFSTTERKDLFALGFGGEYRISRRYALMAEYYLLPLKRNPGTKMRFHWA